MAHACAEICSARIPSTVPSLTAGGSLRALQYSGVHTESGRAASAPGLGVARVCGRSVLSNDAVNALAAALTALAGAAAAVLLQR